MDPITLAILAGATGAGVSALPTLIPSKAHRANKKDLEELERLERKNQLGLTSKEEAAMANKLRAGATAAQEQSMDLQSALLAGGGAATGGQALARAAEAQQQRMAAETDVAAKVLDADLQREQQQRDEMRNLQAAIDDKRQQRVQAVADIGASAIEGGMSAAATEAMQKSASDVPAGAADAGKTAPETPSQAAITLGMSEEEKKKLFTLHPEIMEFYRLHGGD